MDDLKRMFQRFEGMNDFAGFVPRKEYAAEAREEVRKKVTDGEVMDMILYYQCCSVDAAFLDGFRYGMKFLIENILQSSDNRH